MRITATPRHEGIADDDPTREEPARDEHNDAPVGRVAVAGATGVVGVHVVSALRAFGYQVVPISRSTGVDLTTGEGLAPSVAGADTIIDVASITTSSGRASSRFFEQATRRLLAAAKDTGAGHYVVLSIVGTDQIDSGYYHGKRIQEQLVEDATIPHTIVRATQFHEFARQMMHRMAAGPVALVPLMQCQPVAAAEVAQLLAAIVASGAPAASGGRHTEIAGPEIVPLLEMVRRFQRHVCGRRLIVPLPLPGRVGRQFREGALLPDRDHVRGVVTFDEWLSSEPTR